MLEKDTSCCILERETDILNIAIDLAFDLCINDFQLRKHYSDPHVHRGLFKTLIEHGAPIGSYDPFGNTPLFHLCSKPIPGIFQLLIDSKASPWIGHASRPNNSLDLQGPSLENIHAKKFNLLDVALKVLLEPEGDSGYWIPGHWMYLELEKIILYLLSIGMRVHPSDSSLVNFLHLACRLGRLECVQTLVNSEVDIHAAGHTSERYFRLGTALHAAVIGGQVEILQYLLDIGANVHLKAVSLDKHGGDGLTDETAIQMALRANYEDWYRFKGKPGVFKVLLEVSDRVFDCTTALDVAIKCGYVEMVDLLLRRTTHVGDIRFPWSNGIEIVQTLINRGIIVDFTPKKMMTWHESAIGARDIPLLELLVAQSGSLLSNPLSHIKMVGCSLDLVQFLVERYGCDINVTFQSRILLEEPYDTNVLLEACKFGDEKIVRYLLENGADPDGPGLADTVLAKLFRKRPLAFYKQSTIQLLLDHGADINGTKRSPTEAERHPRTLQPPLICAIEDRKMPMVECLVSRGADVNATSGPETPLHLARREGYDDIADYLMRHGAIDRYEKAKMDRRVHERPGLTPVTTESLQGHDQLRLL